MNEDFVPITKKYNIATTHEYYHEILALDIVLSKIRMKRARISRDEELVLETIRNPIYYKNLDDAIIILKGSIDELLKIAEVRPYGPNGSEICFDCAEKIPEVVEHNMGIKLFGDKGELK